MRGDYDSAMTRDKVRGLKLKPELVRGERAKSDSDGEKQESPPEPASDWLEDTRVPIHKLREEFGASGVLSAAEIDSAFERRGMRGLKFKATGGNNATEPAATTGRSDASGSKASDSTPSDQTGSDLQQGKLDDHFERRGIKGLRLKQQQPQPPPPDKPNQDDAQGGPKGKGRGEANKDTKSARSSEADPDRTDVAEQLPSASVADGTDIETDIEPGDSSDSDDDGEEEIVTDNWLEEGTSLNGPDDAAAAGPLASSASSDEDEDEEEDVVAGDWLEEEATVAAKSAGADETAGMFEAQGDLSGGGLVGDALTSGAAGMGRADSDASGSSSSASSSSLSNTPSIRYADVGEDWEHLKTLKLVFQRAELEPSQQRRFLEALVPESFVEGDYIVRQGDVGDKFYIITEGEVMITKTITVEEAKKMPASKVIPVVGGGLQTRITYLYDGHFFGETSLAKEEPRNANVIVTSNEATVMSMAKSKFKPFMDEDPKFRALIGQLIFRKDEAARKRQEFLRKQQQVAEADLSSGRGAVKVSKVRVKKRTNDNKVILNNYVLQTKIGQGSYGTVWLALAVSDAKKYAIKMVNREKLKKKGRFARSGGSGADEELLNEVAAMKRLSHPNLVRLYEVIDEPARGKFWMVQEYMALGPIMDEVEYNEPFDMEVARAFFRQIISGVAYMHFQGVVHRDIKPGNVLVGEGGLCKIADFGTVAIIDTDEPNPDRLTTVKGTAAFQPPEVFMLDPGQTYSGFAVDMWALGATLHTMVVGSPPFMGRNELELVEELKKGELRVSIAVQLDPHLKNLLAGLLDVDPRKRFTMEQVAEHDWVTAEGTEPLLIGNYRKIALFDPEERRKRRSSSSNSQPRRRSERDDPPPGMHARTRTDASAPVATDDHHPPPVLRMAVTAGPVASPTRAGSDAARGGNGNGGGDGGGEEDEPFPFPEGAPSELSGVVSESTAAAARRLNARKQQHIDILAANKEDSGSGSGSGSRSRSGGEDGDGVDPEATGFVPSSSSSSASASASAAAAAERSGWGSTDSIDRGAAAAAVGGASILRTSPASSSYEERRESTEETKQRAAAADVKAKNTLKGFAAKAALRAMRNRQLRLMKEHRTLTDQDRDVLLDQQRFAISHQRADVEVMNMRVDADGRITEERLEAEATPVSLGPRGKMPDHGNRSMHIIRPRDSTSSRPPRHSQDLGTGAAAEAVRRGLQAPGVAAHDTGHLGKGARHATTSLHGVDSVLDDLVSEQSSHPNSEPVAGAGGGGGSGGGGSGLNGRVASGASSHDGSSEGFGGSQHSTLSRQESESRIGKLQRTKDFVMVTSKVEGAVDGGTYHQKVIFRARDPSLSLFSARTGKSLQPGALPALKESKGGSSGMEEDDGVISDDESYGGVASKADDGLDLGLGPHGPVGLPGAVDNGHTLGMSQGISEGSNDSDSSDDEDGDDEDGSDYGDVHTIDDMTTTTVGGDLEEMFQEITTQPEQEDVELQPLTDEEDGQFVSVLNAGLETPPSAGCGDVKQSGSKSARTVSPRSPPVADPSSSSSTTMALSPKASPSSFPLNSLAVTAAALVARAKAGKGTVTPPTSSPPLSPRLLPNSRDVEVEWQAASTAGRCAPFRSAAGGGSEQLGFVYAVADAVGKRSGMEDRYAVVPDVVSFLKDEAKGGNIRREDEKAAVASLAASTPHTAFFGVFDGHNGSGASEYLAQRLAMAFGAQESFPEDMGAAIRAAAERVDNEYLDHSEAKMVYDGSTAVVVALRERGRDGRRELLCANVGDSRAVLSRSGEAIDLSEDHKCTRDDEQQRIEEAGGWVTKSRLCGVIAVSRSFGDIEHKRLKNECWGKEFTGDTLIAQPECKLHVVNGPKAAAFAAAMDDDDEEGDGTEAQEGEEGSGQPSKASADRVSVPRVAVGPGTDEFVIIACDGVWDVMTSQQAVNFVRRNIARHKDASKAAHDLVQKALDLNTIDNCSVCLVFFS